MKWFLVTYISRFYRRHKLFGHLFNGRYKALIVHGSEGGHLQTICGYVRLNPGRAKLLRPEQLLREYRWSSWPEYLKSAGWRWPGLPVDRVLGEHRIPQDRPAGRRRLEEALEAGREAEAGGDYPRKLKHRCHAGGTAFLK